MHSVIRRSIAATFTTTLLVAAAATAATAEPQGFDEEDHQAGRFYGNFEVGVLLFTFDVEAYCGDELEPVVTAKVFHREDGGAELMVNSREMPIFLYHSPLGAPEFIGETCGALFDADPATVPVPPFANGTANFKERITISADGVREDSNSINGTATGSDGTTWKVRSWADFVLGDDGVPIGDPADFQGLTIHEIGP